MRGMNWISVCVVASFWFSAEVIAQPAREKAIALTREGVALLEKGKLDLALELFEKAYRLDPAPVLLGHIAKVYDRKGDLRKAREFYERWAAQETDPDRLKKARARLSDLLDRMPGRLTVTASPAGATVTVDGRAVSAGVAVELRRGNHEVEVTLRGHAPARRTVEVKPAEETRVSVVLTPLPGRLEVRGGPAGARVTVNGMDARTLPLDRPYVLPPGLHVVEVTANGYEKMVRSVEVRPDETASVSVVLKALPSAVAVPTAPVQGPTPVEGVAGRAEARSSVWPWVAIGTGAAAVGVGVAMSVLAHLERGKVSGATRDGDVVTGITMQDASSHVDKAKTYDTVGYVMYGLGGAAVVTGVVLALTQPKADAREAAASAGASPVPGGVAFSVAGRF